MKRFTLLPLLFLGLHILQAQEDIKLPGLVVEQNSKYRTGAIKYLANAEIKSAGSVPQRSDNNGKFTLVFADRPGGDVVRIFAAKSGYELVNEAELKQASVIGRSKPLKIVMCKQGRLYDNQVVYYKIAKDAAIASYKLKMATLEKEGKEGERLMAELSVQFNKKIKTAEEAIALLDQQRQLIEKQAKELADKFLTVNLDDESPTYQRAFAAFEARNIELAEAILDTVDLEKRLSLNSSAKAKEEALMDTLQKNIDKRAEQIRQDVNMCLFKARLHKLKFEWAKAERYYDLAIAYDSSNLEVVFEVAHYMQVQNQFAKARVYYEKALKLTSRPFEKSLILNNLGNLLSDNNELVAARQAYKEALQLRRKLAEKNPDVYLPDVAMTLNNLGILLSDNNELVAARQAYEESLQLRRKLAEKNPDVYLPDVATSLNNLGVLFKANNEMVAAQQAYKESLQLYRKLAEKNPDVYLPYVATNLNNLGALLKVNNEMDAAKQAYEEALQLRRKLAGKNPLAYNLYVASTAINIGLLYEQMLKSTGNMSLKAKGLELMRDAEQRLAIFPETHPQVQQYRPYIERLTQFFNDFDKAAFQLQQQINRLGDLEKANQTEKDPYRKVQRQQQIIGLLSEIEKGMPDNKKLANLMAARYGSLAWYQLFIRQFDEAEQAARKGLAKDPGEEWINTNLALALLYQGNWKAAKQIYETLKDKAYGNGTYRTTFLEDLDALEKEGITHPDVAKARKLLEKK